MKRYIVIGGNPFTGYTATTSFTSLKVVGDFDTVEAVSKCVNEAFDECAGLLLALDTKTGKVIYKNV